MGVKYADIPGWPGYRVGDDGSVWSRRNRGAKRLRVTLGGRWRQLRDSRCTGGYRNVSLSDRPRRCKSESVHRLVLLAFVGPPPAGYEACHINGDNADNRLANLRWATPLANHADKIRHGTTSLGETNPLAKLTAKTVREIRARAAAGESGVSLAHAFGVSPNTTSRVIRRITWRHVA